MATTQKIRTFLWFDACAEEAANHYVSIFKDGRIVEVARLGEPDIEPAGVVKIVTFEIAGQEFIGLDGGPMFRFTEAISLVIDCDSQAEVDELWTRLSEGGEPGRCGWLKDKFGLSWQVVPTRIQALLRHSDPAAARRVFEVVMGMDKLDIAACEAAAAGA